MILYRSLSAIYDHFLVSLGVTRSSRALGSAIAGSRLDLDRGLWANDARLLYRCIFTIYRLISGSSATISMWDEFRAGETFFQKPLNLHSVASTVGELLLHVTA